MNKLTYSIIVSILFAGNMGCSDFLDTNPTEAIPDASAVESVTALRSVLEQTYKHILNYDVDYAWSGLIGYQMGTDLRGTDLMSFNNVSAWTYFDWYQNMDNLTAAAGVGTYTPGPHRMWNYFYNIIRQTNTVIANIDEARGTDNALRNAVKGEAMALRAYSYFYLAQAYQQTYKGNENLKSVILHTVPFIDPFDVANHLPRASTQEVYDLVRSDLNTAIGLLPAATGALGNRVSYRVNKNIAQAMLAKVSLVTNEWSIAESMAHAARDGFGLMTAADYLKGFVLNPLTGDANNPEWMWYVPQTSRLSLGGSSPSAGWGNRNRELLGSVDMVMVSYDLMDLYEPYDIRFSQFWERADRPNPALEAAYDGAEVTADGKSIYYWTSNKHSEFFIGSFEYAGKRKVNPFYTGTTPSAEQIYTTYSNATPDDRTYRGQLHIFRAAEMWLIEAEAMARQGNDAGALALLNELRAKRTGDPTKPMAIDPSVTGNDLIEEILLERRRELYAEGSFLFDRLRTKRGITRGPDHLIKYDEPAGSYRFIFQIPRAEFIYNTALSISNDQNPLSGTDIPSNMIKN